MITTKHFIQILTVVSCLLLFSCFHSDSPSGSTSSSDWGEMIWGTDNWNNQ